MEPSEKEPEVRAWYSRGRALILGIAGVISVSLTIWNYGEQLVPIAEKVLPEKLARIIPFSSNRKNEHLLYNIAFNRHIARGQIEALFGSPIAARKFDDEGKELEAFAYNAEAGDLYVEYNKDTLQSIILFPKYYSTEIYLALKKAGFDRSTNVGSLKTKKADEPVAYWDAENMHITLITFGGLAIEMEQDIGILYSFNPNLQCEIGWGGVGSAKTLKQIPCKYSNSIGSIEAISRYYPPEFGDDEAYQKISLKIHFMLLNRAVEMSRDIAKVLTKFENNNR